MIGPRPAPGDVVARLRLLRAPVPVRPRGGRDPRRPGSGRVGPDAPIVLFDPQRFRCALMPCGGGRRSRCWGSSPSCCSVRRDPPRSRAAPETRRPARRARRPGLEQPQRPARLQPSRPEGPGEQPLPADHRRRGRAGGARPGAAAAGRGRADRPATGAGRHGRRRRPRPAPAGSAAVLLPRGGRPAVPLGRRRSQSSRRCTAPTSTSPPGVRAAPRSPFRTATGAVRGSRTWTEGSRLTPSAPTPLPFEARPKSATCRAPGCRCSNHRRPPPRGAGWPPAAS